MTFNDYLKTCLKNPLFKKYWEEDLAELDIDFDFKIAESLTVSEALTLLEKENLDNISADIIKNKGVAKNIDIGTEIIFFEEEGGKCPVQTFLTDIKDEKLKAKTLSDILLLAMSGNNASYPLSKYVKDGIFELRSKAGSNITRILYFFVIGNKIIMTNGYIKKKQKMDQREFTKAKKAMEKYLKNLNK